MGYVQVSFTEKYTIFLTFMYNLTSELTNGMQLTCMP